MRANRQREQSEICRLDASRGYIGEMDKAPILFLTAMGFTIVAARAAIAGKTTLMILAATVALGALVTEIVRSRPRP